MRVPHILCTAQEPCSTNGRKRGYMKLFLRFVPADVASPSPSGDGKVTEETYKQARLLQQSLCHSAVLRVQLQSLRAASLRSLLTSKDSNWGVTRCTVAD